MWGVCSTKPRQTDLAITNLARQGYGTFNPIFEKRKLDRLRKLITVNAPLFLNYLFIELLDGQRWLPINSTYGVNKLGAELRRIATDTRRCLADLSIPTYSAAFACSAAGSRSRSAFEGLNLTLYPAAI